MTQCLPWAQVELKRFLYLDTRRHSAFEGAGSLVPWGPHGGHMTCDDWLPPLWEVAVKTCLMFVDEGKLLVSTDRESTSGFLVYTISLWLFWMILTIWLFAYDGPSWERIWNNEQWRIMCNPLCVSDRSALRAEYMFIKMFYKFHWGSCAKICSRVHKSSQARRSNLT